MEMTHIFAEDSERTVKWTLNVQKDNSFRPIRDVKQDKLTRKTGKNSMYE